jgi:hypothetical protein
MTHLLTTRIDISFREANDYDLLATLHAIRSRYRGRVIPILQILTVIAAIFDNDVRHAAILYGLTAIVKYFAHVDAGTAMADNRTFNRLAVDDIFFD